MKEKELSEFIDSFNDGLITESSDLESEEQEYLDVLEQLSILKDDTISYPEHLEQKIIEQSDRELAKMSQKKNLFRRPSFAVAAMLTLGVAISGLLYSMDGFSVLEQPGDPLATSSLEQAFELDEETQSLSQGGSDAEIQYEMSAPSGTGGDLGDSLLQKEMMVADASTPVADHFAKEANGANRITELPEIAALDIKDQSDFGNEAESPEMSQFSAEGMGQGMTDGMVEESRPLTLMRNHMPFSEEYTLIVQDIEKDADRLMTSLDGLEIEAEKVEENVFVLQVSSEKQPALWDELSEIGTFVTIEAEALCASNEEMESDSSKASPERVTIYVKLALEEEQEGSPNATTNNEEAETESN